MKSPTPLDGLTTLGLFSLYAGVLNELRAREVTRSTNTCNACKSMWCKHCATRGAGHYPKQRAANVCPYCGKGGQVKPAR